MSSLNKVMLIGRVGNDPEYKLINDSLHLTTFSLATSEHYSDKHGQKTETTEWHRISVWGAQAVNVSKYVAKGHLVFVDGKIRTSAYEKDGVKIYKTEILAHDVKFLTPKSSS